MGKPTPLYHTAVMDSEDSPVKQGEVGELVVMPRKEEKQHGRMASSAIRANAASGHL